jgi:hypothetical protein
LVAGEQAEAVVLVLVLVQPLLFPFFVMVAVEAVAEAAIWLAVRQLSPYCYSHW